MHNKILHRRSFIKQSAGLLSALSIMPWLSSCKKSNAHQFNIGFLTPKTGNDALSGLSCDRGAKIADSFFKHYGLHANIMTADTESNVDVARTKAQKLIQKGAHCLVGAFNSAASAAVADVAKLNKVPFIINLSAADPLTDQGNPYLFRNFPTSKMFANKSVGLIHDLFEDTKFKATSATLMVLNDPYGQTMLAALKAAESQGNLPFKIKEVIQFDYKAKDLSTEVAKVKAINADVLLMVSRLNTTNLIIRELINQKFNPKIILGPANQGFFEKSFYDNFKAQSDYLYTTHAWIHPKTHAAKVASDLFKESYPDEIFELNAGFTLEALYIAALAYKTTNSLDGEILRDAIASLDEENRIMYGGNISFDAKGQRQTLEFLTIMNKDQKPEIVNPKDIKTAEPVLPFPGF